MAGNFVLRGVRVFVDGRIGAPSDVAVVDGRIATEVPSGAAVIDGRGGTLLPGLIDSHVHVDTRQQLQAYGRWGVTTVLGMGTPDHASTADLRKEVSGLATMQSAGAVACAPRGVAMRKMRYPASSAVRGPEDASRFIADRIADGVDYVKIVLEEKLPFQPAPLDEATVSALIRAAHQGGLIVCVHATSIRSFEIAARAGADVLTHAPLAEALTRSMAHDLASRGIAVSPTMTMMKKLVERFPAPVKPRRITYENVVKSVRALRAGGVTILAGTDANSDPTSPNTIEHGAALHEELALLVEAGLSPAEALQAATTAPASVFKLHDRGRIEPGYRADLLLVRGDPTEDILAIRNISRVWIAGEETR